MKERDAEKNMWTKQFTVCIVMPRMMKHVNMGKYRRDETRIKIVVVKHVRKRERGNIRLFLHENDIAI